MVVSYRYIYSMLLLPHRTCTQRGSTDLERLLCQSWVSRWFPHNHLNSLQEHLWMEYQFSNQKDTTLVCVFMYGRIGRSWCQSDRESGRDMCRVVPTPRSRRTDVVVVLRQETYSLWLRQDKYLKNYSEWLTTTRHRRSFRIRQENCDKHMEEGTTQEKEGSRAPSLNDDSGNDQEEGTCDRWCGNTRQQALEDTTEKDSPWISKDLRDKAQVKPKKTQKWKTDRTVIEFNLAG